MKRFSAEASITFLLFTTLVLAGLNAFLTDGIRDSFTNSFSKLAVVCMDPCTSNADCAANEYCYYPATGCRECRPMVCTPGSYRCNGSWRQKCNSYGSGWTYLEDCGSAPCTPSRCQVSTPTNLPCPDTCSSNSDCGSDEYCYLPATGCPECRVKTCVPGEKRCSGSWRQQCNSIGSSWTSIQDCGMGNLCTPAACLGSATGTPTVQPTPTKTPTPKPSSSPVSFCGGEYQECCGGSPPYGRCNTTDLYCSNLDGGTCVKRTSVCSPNQKICDGNKLKTCSGDGSRWNIQTCSNGCTVGGCKACAPGTLTCSGNVLKLCNADGVWATKQSCPFNTVCNASLGTCKETGGVCIDPCRGNEDCLSGQYCDLSSECPVCRNRACTPGTKRCSGQYLQVCNSVGSGWTSQLCPDGICNSVTSSCQSVVSQPAVTTTSQLLPSSTPTSICGNEWGECCLSGKKCVSGLYCSPIDGGMCLKQQCTPGASICSGNVSKTCKSDGSGFNQRTCSFGCNVSTGLCVSAGTQTVKSDDCGVEYGECCGGGPPYGECNDGLFCSNIDAGTCIKQICKPGERSCSGQYLRSCKPDGSGWNQIQKCQVACDALAKICIDKGAASSADKVIDPNLKCLGDKIPGGAYACVDSYNCMRCVNGYLFFTNPGYCEYADATASKNVCYRPFTGEMVNDNYCAQTDPRYAFEKMGSGCNFFSMGCGETVVAMLLAQQSGGECNALAVTEQYYNTAAFCSGTGDSQHIPVLNQNNLETQYPPMQITSESQLAGYIDAGWDVMMGCGHIEEISGHYTLAHEVVDGNVVYSDPYYGDGLTTRTGYDIDLSTCSFLLVRPQGS